MGFASRAARVLALLYLQIYQRPCRETVSIRCTCSCLYLSCNAGMPRVHAVHALT